MKKVLITGASGFVGSFLVEEAIRQGYDVYAGVRVSSSRKYLRNPKINILEIDLSSKNFLREQFKTLVRDIGPFDYIIHNAGLTKARKKKDFYTVNYEYLINLVGALQEADAIPKKFVFVSSLSAYGPGDVTNEIKPITVGDHPLPLTTYGKSKLKAEEFLESLDDFPYIILRPTAIYGPREKDIFLYIKLINRRLEISFGKRKQALSFLYVKDMAKAAFLVLNDDSIIRSGYFVSDGRFYDMDFLRNTIKKYIGKGTMKIYIPMPILKLLAFCLEKLYGIFGAFPVLNREKISELESENWVCDLKPLVRDFEFKPEYNLEKGLRETIDWYQKNRWI